MQIRTFWKAREQTRKTMLFFAHQPQYSVIFVGRKLGRFGVPGFCVVCLLCLSTRPWGGPPRSGAPQGLGIGNIMLVMQGKPNFQRITGATCAPPRPHRPPPWLDPDPPCRERIFYFRPFLFSADFFACRRPTCACCNSITTKIWKATKGSPWA